MIEMIGTLNIIIDPEEQMIKVSVWRNGSAIGVFDKPMLKERYALSIPLDVIQNAHGILRSKELSCEPRSVDKRDET